MIRIQDFNFENTCYEIYLTEDVHKKSKEIGLHEGVFLGAVIRLINRINKKNNTYYYAEQNILFFIEAEEPNKFFFVDLKRLNIFEKKKIAKLKDAINDISRPEFFRTYEDGRKVYLNGDLPLKMKSMAVPPHFISLKNVNVDVGPYSMFENGIVVDFYYTEQREYFITNITKPDYLNFGLAIIKN